MDPVITSQGDSPLILAFPHVGTHVPAEILADLNDEGRVLRDTDWHLHDLYGGLVAGATTVRATFHRYVIDANRDPSGQSLYPGQTTTGLVPMTTFDDVPIWRIPPDAAAIADRLARFHAPYHAALSAQIERVRARHGHAVVYDCHSIRSVIPWLFKGVLPDLNIGTNGGTTCAPQIEAAALCAAQGTSHVLNGRFRGGWTTRHYGRPHDNVHAIQMELAQSSHLTAETPPFTLDPDRSARLRPRLTAILNDILQAAAALPRQ